jgi:hypothetical protein
MAEQTDEEKAAEAKAKADADAAAAKAKADAEVKFSQAELDRIAGESRAAGRGQAEKDLLAKLGVESVEQLEARVNAAKAAEDAQKTELEKANEARAAAEKEAARASELAHRAVAVSRVEGQLRDAGIKPERIPAALKLVDLSSLKVEGTDVSGVSEAIESVKSASPEWFGTVKHTAPDASQQQGGDKDYRNADRDTVAADLYKEYGIRI